MSHLGSLSCCMMESDPEARSRAKWLRGQSLAVSVVVEVAIVAALLIVPLLAPDVLPPAFIATPAQLYAARLPIVSVRQNPPGKRNPFLTPVRVSAPVLGRPSFASTRRQTGGAPPRIAGSFGDASPGGILGGGTGAAIRLEPPQAAALRQPVAQSEGVMAARLIRRVQPEYPRLAQLMRLSGTVRLSAIVGTDGSIRQLEVLSGNPILARAAVKAVRLWRYEPTQLDGQPVEVQTSITVTFVLQ